MNIQDFDIESEYVTEQMEVIVEILQEYDAIQQSLILSRLSGYVLHQLDYDIQEHKLQ